MKLSNILLATLFLSLTLGMVASNYILKKEYDKIDRTDPFWNWKSLCDKSFKHIAIKGGNKGNVYFEPGKKCGVRIPNWSEGETLSIKAEVKNDTLFLVFPDTFLRSHYYPSDPITYVRITSPSVNSVSGTNCRLVMDKMTQSDYQVQLSGKSILQIHSSRKDIRNLNLLSSDSSQLTLDVSKDAKFRSNVNLSYCSATLENVSHLSVPGAIIGNLRLKINDQSSVELSGYNMKKIKQEGEFLTSKE